MKTCWKCKLEQPLENFYKDSHQCDGKQKACKTCQKSRNATYAASRRDYFRQKSKENYDPSRNKDRYQKYRPQYLERRKEQSTNITSRLKTLLNSAKRRAATGNLEYSLDFEWLSERYDTQDGRCSLTGIELECSFNQDGSKRYMPFSPSLDRIDSQKGYTKDNVRLVCTAINIGLNQWGEDTFEKICRTFLAYRVQS